MKFYRGYNTWRSKFFKYPAVFFSILDGFSISSSEVILLYQSMDNFDSIPCLFAFKIGFSEAYGYGPAFMFEQS